MRYLMLLILCVGSLGCAASICMPRNPDLTVVRMGASREEIELQLGPALNDIQLPGGSHVCTYQYSANNTFFDQIMWGRPEERRLGTVTVQYGPDMLVIKYDLPAIPFEDDWPMVIHNPPPY